MRTTKNAHDIVPRRGETEQRVATPSSPSPQGNAGLRPLGAEALQEARKAAKLRFIEIALSETPKDVRLTVPRRSLTGRTGKLPQGGYRLDVPRPFTRQALYVFLHECAHIVLGHCDSSSKSRHRQEYEAERFAHEAMRRHGVPVPRRQSERAKRYVARKIEQAARRGAKRIDGEAAGFAGIKLKRRIRPLTLTLTLMPEHLRKIDAYREEIRQRRVFGPTELSRSEAIREILEMA
jgi:hypothetical protein